MSAIRVKKGVIRINALAAAFALITVMTLCLTSAEAGIKSVRTAEEGVQNTEAVHSNALRPVVNTDGIAVGTQVTLSNGSIEISSGEQNLVNSIVSILNPEGSVQITSDLIPQEIAQANLAPSSPLNLAISQVLNAASSQASNSRESNSNSTPVLRSLIASPGPILRPTAVEGLPRPTGIASNVIVAGSVSVTGSSHNFSGPENGSRNSASFPTS